MAKKPRRSKAPKEGPARSASATVNEKKQSSQSTSEMGSPTAPSMKKFFNSEDFSDLTIRVAGNEFYVHRVIVCSHSEYFSTKLLSKNLHECYKKFVELKDDDPSAIESMLRFMYGFDEGDDYKPRDEREEGGGSGDGDGSRTLDVVLHARVFGLAQKYGVAKLKQLSKENFKKGLEERSDLKRFPEVVEEVYRSTHDNIRDLREEVVRVSCSHLKELTGNEAFRDVLEESAGFAADIVKLLGSRCSGEVKYQCPNCQEVWIGNMSHLNGYHSCVHCGYRTCYWDKTATREH
ncbi:hypothetical protein FQN54_000455 [Arachnomyces sp. PD_36]|nr:hypothetical protein FQN54_000455 [Arachnomyces sp. PD_36]